MSDTKPILLITGSNQGLGLIAVRKIVRDGEPYHIILTSRTYKKAQEAIDNVKQEFPDTKCTFSALELDIISPQSVITAAKDLTEEYDHIDILANNAGVSLDGQIPDFMDSSPEAIIKRAELSAQTYASNITGQDIVTVALLPLLLKAKSPRVVFTSSGVGSMTWASGKATAPDVAAKAYPTPMVPIYRSSKSGLTMLTLLWGKVLQEEGVDVYTVDPGWNATSFGGGSAEASREHGAQDPEIGGGFLAEVITGKHPDAKFKIVAKEGEVPY